MTATALKFPARSISVGLPPISRVAVILFLWLLPFHSLVIAVLFGFVGVSPGSTRAIAAWKEAAIILFFLWTVVRTLSGRGRRTSIIAPDIAITVLIGLATVSVLLAVPVFNANIPVGAQLYGLRDAVFFMLLYYVGRSMPEIADSDTVVKHAYIVAVVISVIGIVERIFVTPDMLVLLGVASYMNDFLGLTAYTSNNPWGLPANYWTDMGGVSVRRAGSVFLHSQGFALPFLFLMPAASAWALARPKRHRVWVGIGYAILWGGLLVSITRVTTLICIMQVVLFYVMMRRPEWAFASIVTTLSLVAVTVLLVPGLLHFAWETLSWQTGSSTTHLRDWGEGAVAFFEQPWGHGMGTTDAAPLRFLRLPLTADNMYLSYGVQLGIAGLLAFVGALASIFILSWRAIWSAATESRRRVFAVIALTTFGIFLNGITSVVFSSNVLAYVYFLCAGAAMTAAHQTSPTQA